MTESSRPAMSILIHPSQTKVGAKCTPRLRRRQCSSKAMDFDESAKKCAPEIACSRPVGHDNDDGDDYD